MCSSLGKTMDEANTLLPLYNTAQLLFSGLLIRRVNIPRGWRWFTHTLFIRYGWQAQLLNHFGRYDAPKVFIEPPDGGDDDGALMGLPEYYGADVHSWRANVCFMVLILIKTIYGPMILTLLFLVHLRSLMMISMLMLS